MANDPNFRQADDVTRPDWARNLKGWLPNDEQRSLDALEEKHEQVFVMKVQAVPNAFDLRLKQFNEFQKSKGRFDGSCDWGLIDEWIFGDPLSWLRQIIGSCVASNTHRQWVMRALYQTAFFGGTFHDGDRDEFGPNNLSFYAPWSYGMMRRYGRLTGRGDGGFCAPMAKTLIEDGVLPCDTPELTTLLQSRNATDRRDYPEPQDSRLYRDFGDNKRGYLDKFKGKTKYRLQESPRARNADTVIEGLKQGKTAFMCSGIAIRKVGTHRDGFAIHARNPRDNWYHNMGIEGFFYASDGEQFVVINNESWGPNTKYYVRLEEFADWFDLGSPPNIQLIGQIDLPRSEIPGMAA